MSFADSRPNATYAPQRPNAAAGSQSLASRLGAAAQQYGWSTNSNQRILDDARRTHADASINQRFSGTLPAAQQIQQAKALSRLQHDKRAFWLIDPQIVPGQSANFADERAQYFGVDMIGLSKNTQTASHNNMSGAFPAVLHVPLEQDVSVEIVDTTAGTSASQMKTVVTAAHHLFLSELSFDILRDMKSNFSNSDPRADHQGNYKPQRFPWQHALSENASDPFPFFVDLDFKTCRRPQPYDMQLFLWICRVVQACARRYFFACPDHEWRTHGRAFVTSGEPVPHSTSTCTMQDKLESLASFDDTPDVDRISRTFKSHGIVHKLTPCTHRASLTFDSEHASEPDARNWTIGYHIYFPELIVTAQDARRIVQLAIDLLVRSVSMNADICDHSLLPLRPHACQCTAAPLVEFELQKAYLRTAWTSIFDLDVYGRSEQQPAHARMPYMHKGMVNCDQCLNGDAACSVCWGARKVHSDQRKVHCLLAILDGEGKPAPQHVRYQHLLAALDATIGNSPPTQCSGDSDTWRSRVCTFQSADVALADMQDLDVIFNLSKDECRNNATAEAMALKFAEMFVRLNPSYRSRCATILEEGWTRQQHFAQWQAADLLASHFGTTLHQHGVRDGSIDSRNILSHLLGRIAPTSRCLRNFCFSLPRRLPLAMTGPELRRYWEFAAKRSSTPEPEFELVVKTMATNPGETILWILQKTSLRVRSELAHKQMARVPRWDFERRLPSSHNTSFLASLGDANQSWLGALLEYYNQATPLRARDDGVRIGNTLAVARNHIFDHNSPTSTSTSTTTSKAGMEIPKPTRPSTTPAGTRHNVPSSLDNTYYLIDNTIQTAIEELIRNLYVGTVQPWRHVNLVVTSVELSANALVDVLLTGTTAPSKKKRSTRSLGVDSVSQSNHLLLPSGLNSENSQSSLAHSASGRSLSDNSSIASSSSAYSASTTPTQRFFVGSTVRRLTSLIRNGDPLPVEDHQVISPTTPGNTAVAPHSVVLPSGLSENHSALYADVRNPVERLACAQIPMKKLTSLDTNLFTAVESDTPIARRNSKPKQYATSGTPGSSLLQAIASANSLNTTELVVEFSHDDVSATYHTRPVIEHRSPHQYTVPNARRGSATKPASTPIVTAAEFMSESATDSFDIGFPDASQKPDGIEAQYASNPVVASLAWTSRLAELTRDVTASSSHRSPLTNPSILASTDRIDALSNNSRSHGNGEELEVHTSLKASNSSSPLLQRLIAPPPLASLKCTKLTRQWIVHVSTFPIRRPLFCMHVNRAHNSSQIYFRLMPAGIFLQCHSSKARADGAISCCHRAPIFVAPWPPGSRALVCRLFGRDGVLDEHTAPILYNSGIMEGLPTQNRSTTSQHGSERTYRQRNNMLAQKIFDRIARDTHHVVPMN